MKRQNNINVQFTAVTLPLDKKDGILIDTYDFNELNSITEYINSNNIKKVCIQGCINLDFLKECKNIEFVDLRIPFQISALDYMNRIYKMGENNAELMICDLTPLQNLGELKYLSINTIELPNLKISVNLDAVRFGLLEYYAGEYEYIKSSIRGLKNLKTLWANSFKSKNRDLSELNNLSNLESLYLTSSNIVSLNGIENFVNLKELTLSYNRSLRNIDSLAKVSKSLCCLELEKNKKIEKFDVLKEMNNLIRLELIGDNEIENLNFIGNMPLLKTLIFEFNIMNGNLDNCLSLSYVHSLKNRKHYNLNDTNLPKIKYVKGNESLVEWLRLK